MVVADRCRGGVGDVFASIESEEAASSPALRRVGVGPSGMADTPDINTVEPEDDYIHVRFRDPDRYDEIRTPEWAAQPARSVSEGSEVRTGKLEGEDEWEITSVLLDKHVGEETAKDQAREIVDKIES